MASSGQVRLRDVKKMLKKCAPGYGWVEKDHFINVSYKNKTFWQLPDGSHDSKG